MIWFYIALTLISATGVFLVGRLLRKPPAKPLIGAWICLATGAGFFLIYALDGERSVLHLAAALTIFGLGALALIGATLKRSN
jgi:hypothetical protein